MQAAAPKPKVMRRAHPGQGVPVWRASKWPKQRSCVENGERGLGRDHLYSVAAITNAAGAVVERYRYSSYGERTVLAPDGITTRAASSYNQQVGFTGRYLDKETGLWYFRARYYSGSLGRFIGRDPIGYVDGASLYNAYFVPNALDPRGLWKWLDGKRGGGEYAFMEAEKGDTIRSAAIFTRQDERDADKWLYEIPLETPSHYVALGDSIKINCAVYRVPNTMYAYTGDLSGVWWSWTVYNPAVQMYRGLGFNVVERTISTHTEAIADFANPNIYGFLIQGHGNVTEDNDGGTTFSGVLLNNGGTLGSSSLSYAHHRLVEIYLIVCQAGRGIWGDYMSQHGILWADKNNIYMLSPGNYKNNNGIPKPGQSPPFIP